MVSRVVESTVICDEGDDCQKGLSREVDPERVEVANK